jgi:hypothetical protein
MPFSIVELDEDVEGQTFCPIITPFRKYKYTHLDMGLKFSPKIAQEVMEYVVSGIDVTDMCIDDVGAHGSITLSSSKPSSAI